MPEPASSQGDDVLGLWQVLAWVAVGVGAAVVVLLAVVVARDRRRASGGPASGELPAQTRENVPLEVAYTAVPLLIVAALFAITLRTQPSVTGGSGEPGMRVVATAFQWGWRFVYPAADVTVLGDANSPPTLVLPLDVPTRLELRSPDVIHSFSVPAFLAKRDVIPGRANEIDLTPTRAGRYAGYCTEYCGLEHAAMTFEVEVVPEPEFDRWLAARLEEQRRPTKDPETDPGNEDVARQALAEEVTPGGRP